MIQTSISVPEEIKTQVEEEAERENRSFSQQVVYILKKYYPEQARPEDVINKKDPQTENPQ